MPVVIDSRYAHRLKGRLFDAAALYRQWHQHTAQRLALASSRLRRAPLPADRNEALPLPHWHRAPHIVGHSGLRWEPATRRWQVVDGMPRMELGGVLPLPGWNMLELELDGSPLRGLATLVLTTAQRTYRIEVSLCSGRLIKRMLFMPLGVRSMHLELQSVHGTFRFTRLRCVWLSPAFAHDRLARRLASLHPDYKGRSVPEVVRALHCESVAQARSWRSVALEAYSRTYGDRYSYAQWIQRVEASRQAQEHGIAARPLLTMLMPVEACAAEASPEERDQLLNQLRDSLRSLRDQRYARWELCVVLSPQLPAELASRIERLLHDEPRAWVRHGHSATLMGLRREAFVQASGDGVMWMGPGDRLAPHGLLLLARAWGDQPEAQLFYADDDFLDAKGRRQRPRFKPAWNPDLLLSSGYIGRPVLYRRTLLWRLEVYSGIAPAQPEQASDDALDYALVLRFLAWWHQLPAERQARVVCHLPEVLYHRRYPATPASDPRADTRSADQAQRVHMAQSLLGYLESGALALPGEMPHEVRIRWPLPEPAPLVSLLVPTRDGVEILKPCVDAILERTDYRHFELLILDNQSACPHTLAYMDEVVERDARVRVLRWNHPFNYSAVNNFGARQARGEIIGLINNDVEPMEGTWLTEMVSQVCRPEIGCVGAKLYYPNDTVQHGGVILGLGGVAGHAHRFFQRDEAGYCGRLKLVQNLSAVTAACLLLRREVFEAVGGLNEPDLAVAYNDVDLCLKVREAGYRNLWTPYAELYHHESISRGADDTPVKRARWLSEIAYMKRTWGKRLQQDPAYNPNLTLAHEDFSLR